MMYIGTAVLEVSVGGKYHTSQLLLFSAVSQLVIDLLPAVVRCDRNDDTRSIR